MADTIQAQENQFSENYWTRWMMQTARTWQDIAEIVHDTGIDMVDSDHRKMIEYALEVNQLIELYEKDGFSLDYVERQRELFDKIYHYTEDHFRREEQMMRGFQLEGYEQHKEQHEEILAMIRSIIQDFQSGRITISLQFKLAVLDWVVVHINEVDYNAFNLKNLHGAMERADSWEDVSQMIRSTGVESIDDDHKNMTEWTLKLNQIIDSPDKERLKPEGLKIFEKVIEITDLHFQREEKMIEEYKLSGAKTQKEQHQKFLEMLESSKRDYESGKIEISSDVKFKILEWWVNHINVHDFNTFCAENWALKVMEKAKNWDDVSGLIKKMGIEVIDEDHRIMTEYALDLNHLIDLKNSDEPQADVQDKIEQIFGKLYDFAIEHFSREERLIQEGDYPGYNHQAGLHQTFLQLLDSYREQLSSGRLAISTNLKTAILEWWINHINVIDYNTFVKKSWD